MSRFSALSSSVGPLIFAVFGGLALFGAGAVIAAGERGPGLGLALVAVGSGAAVAIVAILKRRLLLMEAELRELRKTTSRELGTIRRSVEAVRRDVGKQVFDPYAYWEQRIDEHGPDAVGDLSRPLEELAADTRLEKAGLLGFFAHLVAERPTPPARILDFGCGFGRFTSDLAELCTDRAIGVDATPSLLEQARLRASSDEVEFHQARGRLPFPDGHFDAIWIAYVLIHLVGRQKEEMVAELDRVLAPGGLLFLTEGVTTWRQGSAHCEFVPFEWYARHLPGELRAYRRDAVFTAAEHDDGFAQLSPLSAEDRKRAFETCRAQNLDLHLTMVAVKG